MHTEKIMVLCALNWTLLCAGGSSSYTQDPSVQTGPIAHRNLLHTEGLCAVLLYNIAINQD